MTDKKTYYIHSTGVIKGPNVKGLKMGDRNKLRKEFGNLFNSEAEAVKARDRVEGVFKKRGLAKGERIIRVVTPMGINMGSFITHESALLYLAKLNNTFDYPNYFRWNGIKREELGV